MQPESQTEETQATTAAPIGCQLMPDAETLEIQLRNMYDHLYRLVKKAGRGRCR
jgi:hypothetical protein